MAHYVKLFDSLIHSTLWQEGLHVKVVWITMLAMADSNGEVYASIPGLAKAAGVSIPQCEEALAVFMSPDPYSRSKECEGRRLCEIKGGFELINYKYYRDLKSSEQEKEFAAERAKRYRDRKNGVTLVTENHGSSRQEEEDVKEDVKNNNYNSAAASPPLLPEEVNGKKRNTAKSKKFDIPALSFTPEMETAFERVWNYWPKEGWDFTNKKPQLRRKDSALAKRRFKEILDNFKYSINDGPMSADQLAECAIAFVDSRIKEAQGAIPNVPCIANFFSSEEVSKKHWQNALVDHFGIAEEV